LAVVGVLLAGTLALVVASTASASPRSLNQHKQSRDAFRAEMRKLWEDHIVWTRQYIVSAATLPQELPDTGATAERLFANQAHIGSAIAGFYGQAAGDQLTALLNDHIAVAAEVITAARAGNDEATTAALDRWYANADDIAEFLATANPKSWPFDAVSAHMRDHLDLTLAEAVARLKGDYPADIAAYDAVHEQILHMADMLSAGIIDQFPTRFAR
jgi:hypothetical protein